MTFASASSAGRSKKKNKKTDKDTLNSKSDMINYICVRIFSYEREGLQLWNHCIELEILALHINMKTIHSIKDLKNM